MEKHDVHRYVLTDDDLEDSTQVAVLEAVDELQDTFQPRFEVQDGRLELVTEERLPPIVKEDLRQELKARVSYEFGDNERLYLDRRVSWPVSRYELCIGYR